MTDSNQTDNDKPSQKPDAASGGKDLTPAQGEPPASGARGVGVLAGLALLIALLAAAGAGGAGYYFHQRLQAVERTTAERASSEALQALSERLTERTERLAERVDNLAGRTGTQTENLVQLREALDGLRQDQRALAERMRHFEALAESRRYQWARSEAAYLASVAATRLELHRDVDAALQALKEADALLAGFGGRTVDARQGLNKAIDALLAVNRPDVGALSDRLMGLSASVAELPLRGQPAPPGATDPAQDATDPAARTGWRGAAQRAWDRFRSSLAELVVIRRAEDKLPLVSPEQRFFLTQNLRLQLETARAALVRSEAQLYRDSLRQAERWLSEFYDTDRDVVETALAELQRLRERPIRAELPDIRPMLAPLTGGGDA